MYFFFKLSVLQNKSIRFQLYYFKLKNILYGEVHQNLIINRNDNK